MAQAQAPNQVPPQLLQDRDPVRSPDDLFTSNGIMSISSVKVSPYISFTLEGKSPKMFEVYGDGGKLLLTAYRDGGIKSPTRDDMNEAARLFWKLMAQQFHDQIVEGFKQKKETGCSGGLQ